MDYLVKGYFYYLSKSSDSVKARSVLTITRNTLEPKNQRTYDLLVIMMNPGKSSPKDARGWRDSTIASMDNLVEAHPDDTQFQIMKVMDRTGYENALILNLSDVCETNSYRFTKNLNRSEYPECDERHSIFSDSRSEELMQVLSNFAGDTAIVASGVNYKLRFLTQKMLSKVSYPKMISKHHKNGLFYHPLPRGGQSEWVNHIVRELNLSTKSI